MTSSFSKRFGFDPRRNREPILEDAPGWLRIGYINGILNDLTFIDRDSRFVNNDLRPLGIKSQYEKICAFIMVNPDQSYTDSWACADVLNDEIKKVPWYNFFDIVEFVGNQLKDISMYDVFGTEPDPQYTFLHYRDSVNDLFENANVGYRLNDESRLFRSLPGPLAQRVESTGERLKDGLEPARVHYAKARRYIFEHPLDPENGIKEIVSCLESVGRKRFPTASTLGDVVKELNKEGKLPKQLVTVIEKFWVFSCAEPGVRHGSTANPSTHLRDAEFCFHVGVALVRYLLDQEPGK